ncbi:hypothetical protein DPMN_088221 [Dreissena polymorpha]|uniref:Uncharacterized protein n=1 Tax=Dreissena polymorpha TaxID=45954 RepID=A0A9D4QW73_DREPO|nr:hypothetical protein DPMN_088221 [Dreissena polymorpha]
MVDGRLILPWSVYGRLNLYSTPNDVSGWSSVTSVDGRLIFSWSISNEKARCMTSVDCRLVLSVHGCLIPSVHSRLVKYTSGGSSGFSGGSKIKVSQFPADQDSVFIWLIDVDDEGCLRFQQKPSTDRVSEWGVPKNRLTRNDFMVFERTDGLTD